MKKSKTTFKRLVSNLPYNPSLISQVSFYAKRLKQETSIRRLGFVFVALTLLVQLFAVIVPPKQSVARDIDNDILTGGFATREVAVQACNTNLRDFASIMTYAGITCEDIGRADTVALRSTDYNGQLVSMGRKRYNKPNEFPVMINGTEYFMRSLWGWDQGVTSTYQALKITTRSGQTFFLLYNCGNLTTIGQPVPPPPPAPTPVKTVRCAALVLNRASGTVIRKGESISVIGQVVGTNMAPGDTVDMAYDYINSDTGVPVVSPVRANGNLFVNGSAADPFKRTFVMNTPGNYTFRLAAVYNGALVPGSFVSPCDGNITVAQPAKDFCPGVPGTQPNNSQCKPCDKLPSNPCISLAKTASNVTTNTPDANGTMAKAGDVITYTLHTKNNGKETVKKYAVLESMSDVLDYADIIDFHGGKIDADNVVHWDLVDIKPGQTITNKITIKVKNPIPNTPVSTSNPGKFDLVMNNTYGNAVNIKLPPSIIKITERTTTTLPNTGPGENMAIAFALTAFVGYFFARSRLLNKELDLVRQDYAAGEA